MWHWKNKWLQKCSFSILSERSSNAEKPKLGNRVQDTHSSCVFAFISICTFSHLRWPFWLTSFTWHTNKTSFVFVLLHIAGENRANYVKISPISSILHAIVMMTMIYRPFWWRVSSSFDTRSFLFVNCAVGIVCREYTQQHTSCYFSLKSLAYTIWSNVMCVCAKDSMEFFSGFTVSQIKWNLRLMNLISHWGSIVKLQLLLLMLSLLMPLRLLSRSDRFISIEFLWIDQHFMRRMNIRRTQCSISELDTLQAERCVCHTHEYLTCWCRAMKKQKFPWITYQFAISLCCSHLFFFIVIEMIECTFVGQTMAKKANCA